MSYTKDEVIIPRNVEDEMKGSYLRYAMSVIIARALPDVRDGLKPSQRRILFAMKRLNLSPGSKHRKCAKISGDTSGDLHPHGEMVIYPTLVRMAQKWLMRYCLIDGQGNFGSVDGDPPAAMRYTEARLTLAAIQLMEDLDKDTVNMVSNYDETLKEPVVFPSKFPNLLCNGSSGIAVGMATNIPPHNLVELSRATSLLLQDPKTSIDDILKVMPGPDFPTGGVICGYRGIKEAFHTGRGKVILRGLARIEDLDEHSDRQQIVIEEIPYNVNKSRLIEQIADLITNKTVTGISDIRDDSDKDGLKIVVELKKGEVAEVILNQLYKFSDMQITFGCNMLALDRGLPKLMNVRQMINAWIDHRIEVVRRRTRFELSKAEARAHILEGFLKALDCLDQVVKIIRSSQSRDDAKKELMHEFSFSDKQASSILDLRLYQLTGLELEKLTNEYNELLNKIAYLQAVLASEQMVKEIIETELKEVQKNHTFDRRTKIIAAENEMNMEDLIANDQVIINISQDDYIKRMPMDTFKEQKRGGMGTAGVNQKREDDITKCIYTASMHDYLLIFTNLGQCHWIKVWQLPEASRRAKGKPLVNLLEGLQENENIATILRAPTFDENLSILMATKLGVVKKTSLLEFSNPRRKGIKALGIDEGDELIAARMLHEGQQVMLFTHEGMAVRFDEAKVRKMGRSARGVKGVTLKDEDDYVVSCEVVNGDESMLVVCENGFGKRSNVEEFRQTNRGSKGVRSIITSARNGKVAGAICVGDSDGLLMVSALGQTIRISMKHLRIMGRNTQGVKLANLKDEDSLVVILKIEGEEDSLEDEPLSLNEEAIKIDEPANE